MKYGELASNRYNLEHQEGEDGLIVAVVVHILVVIHAVIRSGTPLSLGLLLLRASTGGQDRDGRASGPDGPGFCRLGRTSAQGLATWTPVGRGGGHRLALALIRGCLGMTSESVPGTRERCGLGATRRRRKMRALRTKETHLRWRA